MKFTDSFDKVPQDFADDIGVDVAPIMDESEEKAGDVTPAPLRPQRTKPPSHLKYYVTKAVL